MTPRPVARPCPTNSPRLAGALLLLILAVGTPAQAQSGAAGGKAANPSLQEQKDAMARDAKATGAGTMSLGKRAVEGAKGTFRGFGEAFRDTRDSFKQRQQKGFLSGPGSHPDNDPVNH